MTLDLGDSIGDDIRSWVSYDGMMTRVVLSVEACSFIQRSYRSIPVSGLLAKVSFGAVTECYIIRAHAY